jgi:hypothetical protein
MEERRYLFEPIEFSGVDEGNHLLCTDTYPSIVMAVCDVYVILGGLSRE